MSETTVLVVANRTASTPAMLAEVHRRRETCRYGLMVPPDAESDWSSDDAVRLVGRAAEQEVAAVEPGPNAAATIHDLVEAQLGACRRLPRRLDAEGDQPCGNGRVRQLLAWR